LGLQRAKLLDLGLELGHRLLKVEVAAHRASNWRTIRDVPSRARETRPAREG
jgi:hypothetical protein